MPAYRFQNNLIPSLAQLFAAILLCAALSHEVKALDVRIGSVETAGLKLSGVEISTSGTQIEIRVESVLPEAAPDNSAPLLTNALLLCNDLDLLVLNEECATAEFFADTPALKEVLHIKGRLGVEPSRSRFFAGWLNLANRELALAAQIGEGGEGEVNLQFSDLPVSDALGIFPDLAPEGLVIQAGTLSGNLVASLPATKNWLTVTAAIDGLSFDSESGYQAGAGLEIGLEMSLDPVADKFPFNAHLTVDQGELLLGEFYTLWESRSPGGAVVLSAEGFKDSDSWIISRLRVVDPLALEISGNGRLSESFAPEALRLSSAVFQFPEANDQYLNSLLSSRNLGDLAITGEVEASLDWTNAQPFVADVQLTDVSIDDPQQRLSVAGLTGQLPLRTNASEGSLQWGALEILSIPIAEGLIAFESNNRSFTLLETLALNLLGGDINIAEFSLADPLSSDRSIVLKGSVDNIQMPALSRVLGWPQLGGTLSGTIPSVALQDGTMLFDGELAFTVFDGAVQVNNLRLERIFSVLPVVAGDLSIQQLDLEQLTGAFSFGKITGRLNGGMRNLRLVNWAPTQFDAFFQSDPEYRGERRISQRAVDSIASIGGGPVAAVSGGVLGLFDEFRYKRIGFRCVLRNNICQMGGIDGQTLPFTIIEGAGLPRISIQGYNETVDWPQLLAELKAATQSSGPSLTAPGRD